VGDIGVGKTFLAWMVAGEFGYNYFPNVGQLEWGELINVSGVVIDNCSADRQAHRDLLKTLQLHNVSYAVLVSRQLPNDYIHFVELRLAIADQAKVWDNLNSVGRYGETHERHNLWNIVNPHL